MDLDIITAELKELAEKDLKRAKKVENKIVELIKIKPEVIKNRKTVSGLVSEIYEDLRMKEDLEKTNTKQIDTKFLKKNSKIGRIDRKKAWHNLLYYMTKNQYRLNDKGLNYKITDIEKKQILPEDYDISQTAKIRSEFVFLKDNRLNFHILEDSEDKIKKICLKDNSIIILGRNIVYRINLSNNEIESDNPNCFGLMPIDLIIFVSGQFVFVWRC